MAIRKWVDNFLKKGVRSRAILLPAFVPILIAAMLQPSLINFVIASIVSICWLAFITWRGFRATKAYAIHRDKRLDGHG
ncbi:MAG: hypothetical protein COZ43_12410 [Sphingomonadales bacterium CG_4_10_14_3_um_filter_58_15]|nr:MAG: hypothetical protein COZ43_12410 [Sphingomonadales bacterium CG_4_10_14_3_um_filter_58_15]